jgi:hypothetical protein
VAFAVVIVVVVAAAAVSSRVMRTIMDDQRLQA